MSIFFNTLMNNVLPLFIIILLGYYLGRWRKLDVHTLSSILLYVATPATLFVQLYATDFSISLLKVLLFSLLYPAICGIVAYGVSRLLALCRTASMSLVCQQMFFNAGNLGLPLLVLVFSGTAYASATGNPYLGTVVAAHTIVMCVQGILPTTLGLVLLTGESPSFKDIVRCILHIPVFYIIPVVVIFKALPYDFSSSFFWPSIEYVKSIMIGLSLLTLGIQFSSQKLSLPDRNVVISVLLRCVMGPLFAFVLISIIGITGVIARALFIGASVPTALVVVLLCIECKTEPQFVSQVVLYSMLLSPLTITIVVYLSTVLFPL